LLKAGVLLTKTHRPGRNPVEACFDNCDPADELPLQLMQIVDSSTRTTARHTALQLLWGQTDMADRAQYRSNLMGQHAGMSAIVVEILREK